MPIYSHHLSAVIILFIIGLLNPSLRADMMAEIRGSLEVFRAVAQPDHNMYARVGPKGYGVIRSMIQVRCVFQLCRKNYMKGVQELYRDFNVDGTHRHAMEAGLTTRY